MSESKAKRAVVGQDSPYRRVLILVVICVVGVVVLFVANVVARGFGGDERRLAEAFATSMKQPYIHANFDVSRQAQTNSFSMKGDVYSVELKDISADLTVSAAAQSQDLKLPVKLYATLGDDAKFYVKGSNLDTLADMIGEGTPQINADLVSISKKLNDKWLFIPQSDTAASSCVSAVVEKLQTDHEAAQDVAKLYLKNRFIVVDGVTEKGTDSQEYTVRYKHDELSDFVKKLKQQEFYTSIKSCSDDLQVPSGTTQQTQAAPESESTTKVLVEQGKITSINSTTSYEGRVDTFSASVNYEKGKKLTAPTEDIVKIDSIRSEITSVTRFIMQQQMAASGQTSQ